MKKIKHKIFYILGFLIISLYSCYALMDSSHQTVCYAYDKQYPSYIYVPIEDVISQYYGADNCVDILAFQRVFLTTQDTSIHCVECVVLAKKCEEFNTCQTK